MCYRERPTWDRSWRTCPRAVEWEWGWTDKPLFICTLMGSTKGWLPTMSHNPVLPSLISISHLQRSVAFLCNWSEIADDAVHEYDYIYDDVDDDDDDNVFVCVCVWVCVCVREKERERECVWGWWLWWWWLYVFMLLDMISYEEKNRTVHILVIHFLFISHEYLCARCPSQ